MYRKERTYNKLIIINLLSKPTIFKNFLLLRSKPRIPNNDTNEAIKLINNNIVIKKC